jgi:hypothetical protein
MQKSILSFLTGAICATLVTTVIHSYLHYYRGWDMPTERVQAHI